MISLKKPRSMRVTIEEKHILSNPSGCIKSAIIFRYSDGTVNLSVVKDLGKGSQGAVKGYKTISSAKMTYARRYRNLSDKEEIPIWQKVK